MKWKYGTVLCAMMLLVSCKMFKETTNSEKHLATQYALFTLGSDSAFRTWYFDTDSTFRYHPDSGLLAYSGRLWGQDVRTSQTIRQKSLDSNSSSRDKSQLRKRETPRVQLKYVALGVLLTAMLIAGVVYRRRKF